MKQSGISTDHFNSPWKGGWFVSGHDFFYKIVCRFLQIDIQTAFLNVWVHHSVNEHELTDSSVRKTNPDFDVSTSELFWSNSAREGMCYHEYRYGCDLDAIDLLSSDVILDNTWLKAHYKSSEKSQARKPQTLCAICINACSSFHQKVVPFGTTDRDIQL